MLINFLYSRACISDKRVHLGNVFIPAADVSARTGIKNPH